VKVTFYIAWRYLFSKSQQSVVNLITYVTLLVIIVASAALLVVLSAFSGLKEFSTEFAQESGADFVILSAQQDLFKITELQLKTLTDKGVQAQTVLRKQVLIDYNKQAAVGYFFSDPREMLNETIEPIYGLDAPAKDSLLINLELYRLFGVHPDDGVRINLSVPKRTEGVVQMRLGASLLNTYSGVVAGVFQERQENPTAGVVLPYDAAAALLGLEAGWWVTQIDLNTSSLDEPTLRETVSSLFKNDVVVRSRAESNASLFKLLNSEYVATYVIFSLILVLALFNLAGALSVVVLDKRFQLPVMRQLGMTKSSIKGVFFWLGLLQVAAGSLIGLILGVLLVVSQQWIGWVRVSFEMAYPVALNAEELLLVLVTLIVLGSLASYAAVLLSKPLRQL
jgi:lipoprotein-releasing system permease protein